jgi:hypothetical protein
MLIDEQNKKGGLLGKKLEPVIVDPASDWPLFAEKTRQLLEKDKVAVVFGCWTSVSRKSVLPVFEKDNGLLFYPVQYEGEESSRNVIYTGAAPNQQAIPAVDCMMKDVGVKRWSSRAPTMCIPGRPTRSSRRNSWPKASPRRISPSITRPLAIPTGKRGWPRSSGLDRRARRRRSFRRSTATPTCRFTRNSATRKCPPRTFRSWRSRSGKRNCRGSTPSRSWATWPRGTISKASVRRPTSSSSTHGTPTSRIPSGRRMIPWRPTTSASTSG